MISLKIWNGLLKSLNFCKMRECVFCWPKLGLEIEGDVLHRVGFLAYFCLKQGQDFKPLALYTNVGQIPTPVGADPVVTWQLALYFIGLSWNLGAIKVALIFCKHHSHKNILVAQYKWVYLSISMKSVWALPGEESPNRKKIVTA